MIYIALVYSLMFIGSLIVLQFMPRYTVKSKVYRNGLVILVGMFCYIAYCYIPLRTDDLYRYYDLIDRMRERPVEWALHSSYYRYEPFSNFLFIIVAKLTNNAIYQTLSIVLIYGIFLLNIKKVTNFVIKKEENLYLVTFLSFTILLFSISGTRNTLAALIFAAGLYNETNRITRKSWVLYILCVCTHVGLIPVVLIRFLCEYFPKKRFHFIHIILVFWSVAVVAFMGLFANIQNMYAQVIIRKIRLYIYNNTNVQKFDTRYIMAMLFLCILLVLIYFVEFNSKNSYINFMGYLIAFTLGCFVSPIVFERYIRVLCACVLPMFIDLRKEKWKIKNLIMYSIAVLDVGMLSYQVWMFISHFNSWFSN